MMDLNTAIAAASAVFAGLAILFSRLDAKRAATFEYIRELLVQLERIMTVDIPDAQQEIIDSYMSKSAIRSADAQAYFSFLSAADLLSYAARKGMVNRRLATEYLQSLYRGGAVDRSFLDRLRACCGDTTIFSDLHAVLPASVINASERNPVS